MADGGTLEPSSLLDLVAIAGRPVPLRVCAAALGSSEDEVLSIAEGLVADGSLEESVDGYAATTTTPTPSPVRAARAARLLAEGLIATDSDPAWIGSALAQSDTPEEAVPYLAAAADDLADRGRLVEAMGPANEVLESQTSVDRETEGRMLLTRGRGRSFTGDSEGASDDFEDAAARLTGELRIDALGYAATGASNLQQPQRAERLLAAAAAESIPEFPAKLGSLCALWAREVSRLGFPDEAEALLDKSDALLGEHGSSFQRYLAQWNRAWIYVDRGDYRKAEADLDGLVHIAEDGDHAASDIAEKKAYHGRAQFGLGQPTKAMATLEAAMENATPSIAYLVALARSEGHPRYGAWDRALAATHSLQESVEELVPAWRNVGLFLRAKALAGSGDLPEARAAVAEAILACPPGVNGWRWRQRCRALQMDLAARSGERFPEEEAEGLVEEMLRAQWIGPAAELLVAMARHGKDKARARQAMALAWRGGDVMLAAEAAHVGAAWDSELAAPIVDRVRRIEGELDEDMADQFRRLPHVAAALAVETDVSDDETALRAELEETLTAVLGDDPTLTPAQRRRARAIRSRRRRTGAFRAISSVAVLAIAVLTYGIIDGWFEPPTTTTTTTAPTTTTTLPEFIPLPPDGLSGQAPHRGGLGRTGVFDSTGVPDGGAFAPYWTAPTTGVRPTPPVVFGSTIYVGSDRTFFGLRTDGDVSFRRDATSNITSPAAEGTVRVAGETGEVTAKLVVVGSEDGTVYGLDLSNVNAWAWEFPTGGAVIAAPLVVDGQVIVASTDGFVYALDGAGAELWRYPNADSDVVTGGFLGAPALHDGGVYVSDDVGGVFYVGLDGEHRCSGELQSGSMVNPVVANGFVFISTETSVRAFSAGSCSGLVDAPQPVNNSLITGAPVVTEDFLYLANGRLMTASPFGAFERVNVLPEDPQEGDGYQLLERTQELLEGLYRWTDGEWAFLSWSVSAEQPITGAAVLTEGVLYFADTGGEVTAVNAETGERLWRYKTDDPAILTAPAVIDGAVIVANERGFLFAIGAR